MRRRPPVLRVICAGLAVCGAALAANAAPPLGRLFFAPDERARLEQQAGFGANPRLDGVVVRPDGQTIVWIDGRARFAHARADGIDIAVAPRDPARATLRVGADAPIALKVGETRDRAARGLGAGRLLVHPAPAR